VESPTAELPGVANPSRPCTWSEWATVSAVPAAAASPTADEPGVPKLSRPWTWSERAAVEADPAAAPSPTAEEPGVPKVTPAPAARRQPPAELSYWKRADSLEASVMSWASRSRLPAAEPVFAFSTIS